VSNTDLLSGDLDTQAAPAASGSGEQVNGTAPKRRTGGLSGMVIADLRELAAELGVGDTKGMRKGDLIAAIRERQGKAPRKRATTDDTLPFDGVASPAPAAVAAEKQQEKPVEKAPERPAEKAPQAEKPVEQRPAAEETPQQGEDGARREGGNRRRRGASRAAGSPEGGTQRDHAPREGGQRDGGQRDGGQRDGGHRDNAQRDGAQQRTEQPQRERGGEQGGGNQRRQQNNNQQQNTRGQQGQGSGDGDDEEGGRRGRRFRDRRRRGGTGRAEGGGPDTEIREDDVLLPVAGILDVLDNYAFVRTSGYLPGPNDVYVSLSLVRKYNLRRGDAITGVVKQPREGEQQRQKFNPLVRVDTINGLEPDQAKKRPEFTKLTPLYPNERLRLETESNKLTTRVIDLVMPVGKGQRALIVSPPKAGKTTIMQDIANAITTNNPECHLMVVLVDERPEEVTDMQRSVKGEVIASTFDRPPSDHTSVAELSIERAKRLVEMGMDVVVLLDSITRLGRAYNLAAPASGRILSGGVDSTALFPPKRFLGAARNIENGGSLTIFATAMVETGSTGDTVIFEEFKGTGNAELKLDRKIAERRVFPAVDINPSGTRKEELLLSPDELAVHHRLHRVLHALDSQQAIDLLLSRLRKTKTNIEFLMQVSKTALSADED
jgi:transcription termination factor Rho